jgi:hypothetical protein
VNSSIHYLDLDGIPDEAAEERRTSIYHTLLYTVLQKPREKHRGGIVIALSSSNPGEGVTYVGRALVHELARSELTSVAGINVSFLKKLHEPTVEAIRNSVMEQARRLDGEDGKADKAVRPLPVAPMGRELAVPPRLHRAAALGVRLHDHRLSVAQGIRRRAEHQSVR